VIACLSGHPVRTTKGEQARDFNFVENLVDGFILAAEREEAIGEVINLGSGAAMSILDLVRQVHAATGSRSPLCVGELEYRPTEIWHMVADSTRAEKLLGWVPRVDFAEGLRRTIVWYRAFLSEFGQGNSSLKRLSTWSFDAED
jgi:nucleoside-diphosphate-sugar epimerase